MLSNMLRCCLLLCFRAFGEGARFPPPHANAHPTYAQQASMNASILIGAVNECTPPPSSKARRGGDPPKCRGPPAALRSRSRSPRRLSQAELLSGRHVRNTAQRRTIKQDPELGRVSLSRPSPCRLRPRTSGNSLRHLLGTHPRDLILNFVQSGPNLALWGASHIARLSP